MHQKIVLPQLHSMLVVLLQSPCFTILKLSPTGDLISSRHLAPLQVAALAALEVEPSSRPAVKAMLFIGTAFKEVCIMHASSAAGMHRSHSMLRDRLLVLLVAASPTVKTTRHVTGPRCCSSPISGRSLT